MYTELGKLLRNIRMDRNELLGNMSTKLGYGPAFLSGIEHGKPVPDDFKEKIEQAYDLTEKERHILFETLGNCQSGCIFGLQGQGMSRKAIADNNVLIFGQAGRGMSWYTKLQIVRHYQQNNQIEQEELDSNS